MYQTPVSKDLLRNTILKSRSDFSQGWSPAMFYKASFSTNSPPMPVPAKLMHRGCWFESPSLSHTRSDCQTWWQPASPSHFNWSSRFSALLWIRSFVLWLQPRWMDSSIQFTHTPEIVLGESIYYSLSFTDQDVWKCYYLVRGSLCHSLQSLWGGRRKSKETQRNPFGLWAAEVWHVPVSVGLNCQLSSTHYSQPCLPVQTTVFTAGAGSPQQLNVQQNHSDADNFQRNIFNYGQRYVAKLAGQFLFGSQILWSCPFLLSHNSLGLCSASFHTYKS